jgi:hypothetical protein
MVGAERKGPKLGGGPLTSSMATGAFSPRRRAWAHDPASGALDEAGVETQR